MRRTRFCSACGEPMKSKRVSLLVLGSLCAHCSPRFRRERSLVVGALLLCLAVVFAIARLTAPFHRNARRVECRSSRFFKQARKLSCRRNQRCRRRCWSTEIVNRCTTFVSIDLRRAYQIGKAVPTKSER